MQQMCGRWFHDKCERAREKREVKEYSDESHYI